MRKENCKKISIITLFSIAFAFIESAVVVYLRKLFYSEGFELSSKIISSSIIGIELIREFSTIIVLICVCILAGKKFYGKLAYFLYSFAVWDIFYYIWLKVILNWPQTFLAWDILFLIPIPWAGPVIIPIIYSIDLILLSLGIIYFQDKEKSVKISIKEFFLFLVGSLIILYSFLCDYGKILIKGVSQKEILNYVPRGYNWVLFFIGEFLIILGILFFYLRNAKK